MLFLAPLLWLGQHHFSRDVRMLEAAEFTVRTRRQRPGTVHADGELITHTPVTFRVLFFFFFFFFPSLDVFVP